MVPARAPASSAGPAPLRGVREVASAMATRQGLPGPAEAEGAQRAAVRACPTRAASSDKPPLVPNAGPVCSPPLSARRTRASGSGGAHPVSTSATEPRSTPRAVARRPRPAPAGRPPAATESTRCTPPPPPVRPPRVAGLQSPRRTGPPPPASAPGARLAEAARAAWALPSAQGSCATHRPSKQGSSRHTTRQTTLADMVLPRSPKASPVSGGQMNSAGSTPWNLAASRTETCLPRETTHGLGARRRANVSDGRATVGLLPCSVHLAPWCTLTKASTPWKRPRSPLTRRQAMSTARAGVAPRGRARGSSAWSPAERRALASIGGRAIGHLNSPLQQSSCTPTR